MTVQIPREVAEHLLKRLIAESAELKRMYTHNVACFGRRLDAERAFEAAMAENAADIAAMEKALNGT